MRLSPWGRVVAISALLVVGGAVALAIGGARLERAAAASSYPVTGAVEGLAFDLGDGDIEIVGGGRRDAVEVRRTERYAFGHAPEIDAPASTAGVFGVALALPDLAARPVHGRLPRDRARQRRARHPHDRRRRLAARLPRHRRGSRPTSGAIDIAGYCGNSLDARAGAGDITLDAAARRRGCRCAPGSGSIRAVLPAGRYDLDAESTSGERARARDRRRATTRRTRVQVLSASGDVAVEGRS